MKKVLMIGILSCLVLLSGCTDAGLGKLSAYGDSGHVQCYSGTRLIYDGRSTGKIANSESSDGYYFEDAKTHELVEVSGNCLITYGGSK